MATTIIWTALPYGIKNGSCYLSVLVSPHLENSNSLAEFINWPDTVNTLSFKAFIGGTSNPPIPVELVPDFNADSGLWSSIFHDVDFIRPYKFTNLKNRGIVSYPVKDCLDFVKKQYVNLGKNFPDRMPTLPNIKKNLESISISDLIHNNDPTNGTRDVNIHDAFGKAYNFYDRGLNAGALPVKPHEFDFHEILTMLADFPVLMRKLGLILDFTFTPDLPAQSEGKICVIPTWPRPVHLINSCPFTHYLRSQDSFLATPRNPREIQDGFLNLKSVKDIEFSDKLDDKSEGKISPFGLTQVDPDGAILKLLNFNQNLDQISTDNYIFGMDPEGGLPALRSGGLGLVRMNRLKQLGDHLDLFSSHFDNLSRDENGFSVINFYAEDLLRGYRVDMKDTSKEKTLSLCQRQGSIYINNNPEVPIVDEGYVKAVSATSQEVDTKLYLHETLFRWNGWSLCAERPNQTIVPEQQNNTQVENVGKPINQYSGAFNFRPHIEVVPGSLPRLRFGHSYRLRVRAVDLAGNSLPPDNKNEDWCSDEVVYRRFEPIPPPVLVQQKDLGKGESIERMVIYSDSSNLKTDKINFRHIVPPKTSQEMAELHGKFDEFIDNKEYDKGFELASKEAGSLDAMDGEPASSGKVESNQVVHKENSIVLPYLPDPLATGAALRDIPRLNGMDLNGLEEVPKLKVVKIPFSSSNPWPNLTPFRLCLAERESTIVDDIEKYSIPSQNNPRWNSEDHVFTIYLTKGEKITLRYSSFPPKDAYQLMAIWNWVNKDLSSASTIILGWVKNFLSLIKDLFRKREDRDLVLNKQNYLTTISSGCNWMISPYRKLELVHAVQKPVFAPKFNPNADTKKKEIGETVVSFLGDATIHTWSTGKIELMANWTDWDDTKGIKPVQIEHHQFASQSPIEYEYSTHNQVPLEKNGISLLQHELGETRHHWINYHMSGISRYQEYFDPKINDFSVEGSPCKLNVLNSARPLQPQVEYILPTFGWMTEKNGDTTTQTRIGGGLRVYLKRPWYSSGDDELLGVVLPSGIISKEIEPYVSQWGVDPVWDKDSRTISQLSLNDFSNRVIEKTDGGLSLFEMNNKNSLVNVAGFKPEYNEERKLWFCDIRLDSDRLRSYYPFVHLALARYQPYSIKDAHLSKVLMTEFIQLVPTRILKVKNNPGSLNYDLQLTGFAPKSNKVSAIIEFKDPAIQEEVLAWKPVEGMKPVILSVTPNSSPCEWRGSITLSEQHKEEMRLVVKEYEMHQSDDKNITQIGGEKTNENSERIVYADTVKL